MPRYLIALIPLVVISICALRWFLLRPPRYRKRAGDDLSKFFNALLYQDYENGFLVIEAPNKNRFVQFQRYKNAGKTGIRCDFPLAPWSERYYDLLNRILYEQGFEYDLQPTRDHTVVSFITIDFEQDLNKAMEFAKLVMLDVFKMTAENKIKVYLGK